MKIVDDFWYAYDFENEGYYNTNIRATGKSFKIMKTYTSVAEMIRDYKLYDCGILTSVQQKMIANGINI